jgi:hypothetical protein
MREQKSILKPRLIAALLSELEASDATVFVSRHSDGVPLFTGPVRCTFQVPFENSEMDLPGVAKDIDHVECVCCFSGQRLAFSLRRSLGGQWLLPDKIFVLELRSKQRVEFSHRQYSAEIIGPRGSYYGYAVDINKECIAVDFDTKQTVTLGDSAKIIVRLVGTNYDVFYGPSVIIDKKDEGEDRTRIVFKMTASSQDQSRRQHERIAVEGVSIEVKSIHLDGVPLTTCSIVNYSQQGLTISGERSNDNLLPIPGMILESSTAGLRFLMVWTSGNLMGLKPLLSSADDWRLWHKFLVGITPKTSNRYHVSRRELAQLFTTSGLLKGSRRKSFGTDIEDHLTIGSQESSLLIQRVVVNGDDHHLDLHISFRRIAENAWFIGEATGLTDRKEQFHLVSEACTHKMRFLARSSFLMSRYMTTVWHSSIKSTEIWARSLNQDPATKIVDALQCSIKALALTKGPQDPNKTLELRALSAEARREISLNFSSDLFEVFAGGDGSHPVMNAELGKLGPYHKVLTKVSKIGDRFILAHRVMTHNIWSSTGVTNSVFVIVPKNTSPSELREALSAFGQDQISFGTDDFLMIFDDAEGTAAKYEASLPNSKKFSFLLHDLLIGQRSHYTDSEDESKKRA